MKIEEICSNWEVDSKINMDHLDEANRDIPSLHAKYSRLLSESKVDLVRLEGEYRKHKFMKEEFLTNPNSDDTNGKKWKLPPQGKVFKQDLKRFTDGDPELVDIETAIGVQKECVDTLQRIIVSINQRSFILRAILDTRKFENGLN